MLAASLILSAGLLVAGSMKGLSVGFGQRRSCYQGGVDVALGGLEHERFVDADDVLAMAASRQMRRYGIARRLTHRNMVPHPVVAGPRSCPL